jgi:hypothetical protein
MSRKKASGNGLLDIKKVQAYFELIERISKNTPHSNMEDVETFKKELLIKLNLNIETFPPLNTYTFKIEPIEKAKTKLNIFPASHTIVLKLSKFNNNEESELIQRAVKAFVNINGSAILERTHRGEVSIQTDNIVWISTKTDDNRSKLRYHYDLEKENTMLAN